MGKCQGLSDAGFHNLVQPGYFRNKTADPGSYYGIYKNGQMIAVTGGHILNDIDGLIPGIAPWICCINPDYLFYGNYIVN